MESATHQEWRSRQHVSWPAVLKTASGVGLYLFIFSGGTPWTGGGVANAVLGWPLQLPWLAMALLHFALVTISVTVIALVIYRLRTFPGFFAGTAIALALYGVHYALFAMHTGDDTRAFTAHVVLGLFGSLMYKALSVPRPFMTPDEMAEAHRSDGPGS